MKKAFRYILMSIPFVANIGVAHGDSVMDCESPLLTSQTTGVIVRIIDRDDWQQTWYVLQDANGQRYCAGTRYDTDPVKTSLLTLSLIMGVPTTLTPDVNSNITGVALGN